MPIRGKIQTNPNWKQLMPKLLQQFKNLQNRFKLQQTSRFMKKNKKIQICNDQNRYFVKFMNIRKMVVYFALCAYSWRNAKKYEFAIMVNDFFANFRKFAKRSQTLPDLRNEKKFGFPSIHMAKCSVQFNFFKVKKFRENKNSKRLWKCLKLWKLKFFVSNTESCSEF